MEQKVYQSLPGTVLENLGRLLLTDVTIYVAPMRTEQFIAAYGGLPEVVVRQPAGSDLITVDDFFPKPPADHLFHYLRAAGRIVPLQKMQATAR
jgi:hypothetical protein